MDLYINEKFATEFSETRKSNWVGWNKIKEYIHVNDKLNILDLGCGNGRFTNWLEESQFVISSYEGVDYSDILLNIARKTHSNSVYNFRKTNLLDQNWEQSISRNNYNLIVSFGVTHHLETTKSRSKFFDVIQDLLSNDGIFIVSFWQFDRLPVMKKAIRVSENLYQLTFGSDALRTCYLYSLDEINYLLKNFEIIDQYFADAKNNRGNHYFILKKVKK